MDKKKIILIIGVFLILALAIFVRLQNIEGLYSKTYGEYLPKNPDGYFWSVSPEYGNSLRYGLDGYQKEIWYHTANLLPQKVIVFPLITFIIAYLLLFLLIRNVTKSIPATLIPLTIFSFSIFLFFRTSVGFYDHDTLGMMGVFISLLIIQNKERIGKLFPYLLSVSSILTFFLWNGVGKISMIIIGFYFFYEMFYNKKNGKDYLIWLGLTSLVMFFLWRDQLYAKEIWVSVLIMPFSLFRKRIFGILPIIALAGGVLWHFIQIRLNPSILYAAENIPLDPLFLIITTGFIFLTISIGALKSLKEQNPFIITLLLFSVFLFFYNLRTLFVALMLMMIVLAYSIDEIQNYLERKNKGKFFVGFMLSALFLLLFIPQVSLLSLENKKYSTDDWDNVSMWLLKNTPKDSLILNWWDNGYTIEYLAKRTTLTDGGRHEFDKKIALFLTSASEEEAFSYIKEFPVDYIVFSQNEIDKLEVIEVMSGRELIPQRNKQMISRIMSLDSFNYMELIYQTETVKVYKVNK